MRQVSPMRIYSAISHEKQGVKSRYKRVEYEDDAPKETKMNMTLLPEYCYMRNKYCDEEPRCRHRTLCNRFVNTYGVLPSEFYKRSEADGEIDNKK